MSSSKLAKILFLSFLISALGWFGDAAAQNTVSEIADEVTGSAQDLPGLVAAFGYLLGLLFGVWGVFKLKEHVENPNQTPLRVPLIRFLAGGALISLPIVYEAMATAIGDANFEVGAWDPIGFLSGGAADVVTFIRGATVDLNAIMTTFMVSIESLPGAVAAVGYLLGLILGFAGILKIKDHVENPEQTPLREGVIRLLIGGALFSLNMVFSAMAEAFGDTGTLGLVFSGLAAFDFFFSDYAGDVSAFCNPVGGVLGDSIRDSLCSLVLHSIVAPAFLNAIAYIIGLVLGVWGLLKIKEHVDNPQQVTIWAGVSRLLAGGAFFTLPVIIEVMRTTVTPLSAATIASPVGGLASWLLGIGGTITSYNEVASTACDGLDGILFCMMDDVLGPLHVVINFFAYVAGMVLIMIGISRLIKSAQEGARGPGGFGTIMTFLTGGALISYNEIMRAFTMSFFTNPTTLTFAELSYTAGMTTDELSHVHTIISAVLKFMIVVGLISFVRGLFIIRGVAEGNNQASVMAGVTHLAGGALAVNLGPLINAVQSTLGIAAYGITFS